MRGAGEPPAGGRDRRRGAVDRGQPLAAGGEQLGEHADRRPELERFGERSVTASRERRLVLVALVLARCVSPRIGIDLVAGLEIGK